MRLAQIVLTSAAIICSLPVLAARGQSPSGTPPSPRDLLRDLARFSDADWAAIERGESVARLLETDAREIAVVGAVLIDGPREALLDRYRDVDNLKRSSVVLDVGRFGATPQPSDLDRVTFSDHSLDLRACRAGDCAVRLAAADVERFRREVAWQTAAWRQQSATVWREALAAHAAAYRARGRSALPVFVNKPEPLSVDAELGILLRQFGFVASYSPEFHAYLQQLGPDPPAGAEQTLYWAREDFGVRPILRIAHQVVYRTSTVTPVALVATNQVYADHYLDAAFGVTLAIDAPPGSRGRGFYMIAVNRARTRSLTGFLRRFVRSIVQSRSREAMRKILSGTKIALERDAVRPDPYRPGLAPRYN